MFGALYCYISDPLSSDSTQSSVRITTYLHTYLPTAKILLVLCTALLNIFYYIWLWKDFLKNWDIWDKYLLVFKHVGMNGTEKLHITYVCVFVSRGHSYVAFCFSYYRWEKKKTAFKTNRVGMDCIARKCCVVEE